jgi:hypothetical protein
MTRLTDKEKVAIEVFLNDLAKIRSQVAADERIIKLEELIVDLSAIYTKHGNLKVMADLDDSDSWSNIKINVSQYNEELVVNIVTL